MTDIASQLLATFESLPAREKHDLLTQMLRRSGALPDIAMTDDELTAVADNLFQSLDAGEADGDNFSTR
jgi:hypothetical protein